METYDESVPDKKKKEDDAKKVKDAYETCIAARKEICWASMDFFDSVSSAGV